VKSNSGPFFFGYRLKEAFGGAQNKEIAHRLGLSNSAITTYMSGRIPPPETLVKISRLTGCSIHWLITGEGPKSVGSTGRVKGSEIHSIVLANQKGGEAKSISATILAVEFARRGHRTLLIDTPKGDCTYLLFSPFLTLNNPEKVSSSNMFFRLELKGRAFFRTPFKGLDLCTSNERLQSLLFAGRAKRFVPNLSSIHKEYQFIVLDTDSSVNPFNNVELFMALMTTPTSVLIPTSGNFLSLEAVEKTLEGLTKTQRYASNLKVLGIFLVRHKYRRPELTKLVNKLNRLLPRQVLETVVPEDSGLSELGGNKKYQLSWSKSRGFAAYSNLAEEALNLLGK
jgi:chromosome partitioning protein